MLLEAKEQPVKCLSIAVVHTIRLSDFQSSTLKIYTVLLHQNYQTTSCLLLSIIQYKNVLYFSIFSIIQGDVDQTIYDHH